MAVSPKILHTNVQVYISIVRHPRRSYCIMPCHGYISIVRRPRRSYYIVPYRGLLLAAQYPVMARGFIHDRPFYPFTGSKKKKKRMSGTGTSPLPATYLYKGPPSHKTTRVMNPTLSGVSTPTGDFCMNTRPNPFFPLPSPPPLARAKT